ncbi:Copine-5 [Gonapodya sp. JEL0774]|nr:Copine-5 [Gonapodya sp. JEL0774]
MSFVKTQLKVLKELKFEGRKMDYYPPPAQGYPPPQHYSPTPQGGPPYPQQPQPYSYELGTSSGQLNNPSAYPPAAYGQPPPSHSSQYQQTQPPYAGPQAPPLSSIQKPYPQQSQHPQYGPPQGQYPPPAGYPPGQYQATQSPYPPQGLASPAYPPSGQAPSPYAPPPQQTYSPQPQQPYGGSPYGAPPPGGQNQSPYTLARSPSPHGSVASVGFTNLPPITPQAKLELRISCINLPNKDVMSKSDPRVHVFMEKAMSATVGGQQQQQQPGLQRRHTFVKQWVEVGVTETVKDNLNPVFNTSIPVAYLFETTQLLRFVVVDVDNYKPTAPAHQQDFLGFVEVPLASIVQGSTGRKFERYIVGEGPPGMNFRTTATVRAGTITLAQSMSMGAGGRATSGANELTPGARGATPALDTGRRLATMRISCEELPDAESEAAKTSYVVRVRAEKLDKKDMFGSSDPYLVVSKLRPGGGGSGGGSKGLAGDWVVVHKTETVMNNLNPGFREFKLPASSLTGGDVDRPILWEVWDWDKNSAHDLIGKGQLTVRQLLGSEKTTAGRRLELINEERRAKKGKSYSNSGTLVFDYFSEKREFSFLDYIAAGTEMSLAVAVDFTASNGDPRQSSSLHFRDPTGSMNAYQRALTGVGEVLEPYDSDRTFPAYGFGAKIPLPNSPEFAISHLFPLNLNPTNPLVVGVEGLMEAYGISLSHVQLYGPTNFAPTIRSVNDWARDGYVQGERVLRRYSVLLIVTDGAITDLEDTVAAVIDSSSLPLSIIIVGVGNADFSSMESLDADKGALRSGSRIAERDCVQFVPFRDHPHQVALSQATLAEIPKQFLDYCRAKGVVPAL